MLRKLSLLARPCLQRSRAFATLPPFEYTPQPYAGPSVEEVLSLRKQYLSPSLSLHFKRPVMIVEGKMQYLFDEKGRRYLDAFAGIVTVSVGHSHPEVVKAVNEQNALLQHTTTIYLNPQVAQYGKELADRMPGNLKVFFSQPAAHHCMSIGSLGTCGQHTWKQAMPQGFGIHHALNPDPYRGRFGNDGKAYAADVEDLIQAATPGKVAGFMAETIQGVGGATPLADGYLPEVYKMVRAAGGLCIADEVQTGFGRTGMNYWGFQNQGVLPDIVTMAKGIGNGVPLAAVVTTPEIAASLTQRAHFNTRVTLLPQALHNTIIIVQALYNTTIIAQALHNTIIIVQALHDTIIIVQALHNTIIVVQALHNTVIIVQALHNTIIIVQALHSTIIIVQALHSTIIIVSHQEGLACQFLHFAYKAVPPLLCDWGNLVGNVHAVPAITVLSCT
ncbi:alanine-glyoxylate transaminase [Dunaliella salina]|uniref:alanine--glyoxylate transaminase n=1 Tax=Dunaliella salina TaxID=3046 RepID=A0ABQ7G4N3_DUNSA|nr:alanine-glyoxylate transaminase [Dunaliella salina]|eukprot:KAF5829561.1 alanine-glyoxylate transaminase [Dunaliella salina]